MSATNRKALPASELVSGPAVGSPIIVHSHLRWDFVWQRPQQVLSRLAARHKILFVEEPVSTAGMEHLRFETPHPNVLRVVPELRDLNLSFDERCQRVLEFLRRAMEDDRMLADDFASPIHWFYTPEPAPCFLGQFEEVLVVYDCMDELANFRYAAWDMREREQYLLKHADVVFTGGYNLYESKSTMHPNVHFFGCGVDVVHFGQAQHEATVIPNELAALQKPVLGYFGVIDERIDYDLMRFVAQMLPNCSIVLVGPLAKVDASDLPQLPNLHWLGQRPYESLPAYVKAFDVCLMPFALNASTRYINPTKTLEYMAAGKPIVSTAVPDVVRNFSSIVKIAADPADFVLHITHAFESPDAESIRRGIEMANRSSWTDVVSQMSRLLRSHTVVQ